MHPIVNLFISMRNKVLIVLLYLACGLLSCKQTESSTTTNPINPTEIIEGIHNICHSGLRGNSEELMNYTQMIDDYYVWWIVSTYMNTYNESMFDALMHNRFISSETRTNAVRHIKDMFMQLAKHDGVYINDLDKLMEEHIEYERNKFGRMTSKDLDRDLDFIADRYKQTLQENTLYSANGKIDESFNQGHVSDCWLIAAVKSISLNPKGLEMLNDLVSTDNEGNVTVRLKGIERDYTISKIELEGSNEFAQGDLDVRAIEIAVYRYLHEMLDHTNQLKRIKDYINGSLLWPWGDFYTGMHILCTPYCILFGNEWCIDKKPDKETIEKIKSVTYSIVVSSNNDYVMDEFSKHHAYATTSADDNYIYLSNPYYPDSTLIMTHADFLKYFDCSYSMKLSD